MKGLHAWALAALVGASAPASPAEERSVRLEIEEEVVRYPVQGHDLATLRDALAARAVAEAAGGGHGRTLSDIRIRFEPMPVAGGCVAGDPAIRVRITTTLPEWTPEQAVGPELRERWQALAEGLQRHEARHREHALDAVRDLQSIVSALGVQSDCRALRAAVDQALMRVALRAGFLDRRYDARTRNGVEEGLLP